jgi:arginase
MARVALLAVPYHLGREGVGMANGPLRFEGAGAADNLMRQGHQVELHVIERSIPFEEELPAISDVYSQLAERVREAVASGSFPLVLSGNCSSCLGTLAGAGAEGTGIIWFDAHGDYNTPETTPSGFFDGMGLAIAAGQCYSQIREQIGLEVPVDPSRVLLVGVRDLDPGEEELIVRTGVHVAAGGEIREQGLGPTLLPQLEALGSGVSEVYLHIDLDALDPEVAPANEYATSGGLTVEEVEEAIGLVAGRFSIKAAAITAYNPDCDEEEKTLQAGLRLMGAVAKAAGGV